MPIVKYFETFDEAVEYAKSLNEEVTIYGALQKVEIKHHFSPVVLENGNKNDNNSNTTSVEGEVSK